MPSDTAATADTAARAAIARPYVPRLVLEWLGEMPDASYREIDGSIAFVDISGFTKLSERLARKGKVGAEELTDAIGTCFARLLGVAYGNGGGLIKFGGDALLLLFTGEAHQAKASRAALGMRRALREIGAFEYSGTKVSLRMSVGVHSGLFSFFFVGDSHRELLITGPDASEIVEMEGIADVGEIVVSAATASALPAASVGAAKGRGFLLRREPGGFISEPAIPDYGGVSGIVEAIPLAVRERALSGLDDPEHKNVTVAFLHFDGIDALIRGEGIAAAADALDVLVRDVQGACDSRGVAFLSSDLDRDGGKIILSTGAPDASGADEERMLLALREILDGSRQISVRVGVNAGAVFAGEIGPPYRRTYTVMGDVVNLAARLMSKAAAGQIIAAPGVLTASRTKFSTEPLEPFLVKGKAKPVTAFVVGAAVAAASSPQARDRVHLPLIGRDRERTQLLDGLEMARLGYGRMIEIVGEPGIGKSRLIDEIREVAQGATPLQVGCELYSAATPYASFHPVLRTALGISDDDDEMTAAGKITAVLADCAPELLPWAALVGTAAGFELPASLEVLHLEEKFRKEHLQETVVAVLNAAVPGPTLLTIEDTHWMDESSADLLRHVLEELGLRRWLIVTTRRDVTSGFCAPESPDVVTLHLEPLDDAAAAALVDAATDDSPLAPHEIAALTEKAGGNPLFLTELLVAAQAAGSAEGLPTTVESVVAARIDRLSPQDRTLLRRLSVLGPTFQWNLARSVLPDIFPTPEDRVWDRLSSFLTVDATGMLRFAHALLRDTAYEGLPFKLRRSLHARAGETIEQAAGRAADEHAEILSLHFFHAARYRDAWRYSGVAAARASTMYANLEAATFYERALESAARESSIERPQLVRVYESLGDVRRRIGEYAKAAAAYKAARSLAAGEPVATSRLLQKQGGISQVAGRYPEALRWLNRAAGALGDGDDSSVRAQRARVAIAYASVRKDQKRHDEVIRWCTRAIEDAESAADKDALAHALLLLDTAYVAQARWDLATNSYRALALYEELGNLSGQAIVLNNLGTQAYWRGRWDESRRLYERGRDAWEQMGDAMAASIIASNIGEILSDQGRYDEAEPLFRRALRVAKAAGNRASTAYAYMNLGRVAYKTNRFDEAVQMLERARDMFQDAGGVAAALEAEMRLAECFALQGRVLEALDLIDRVVERSRTLEAGGITPAMGRIRAAALARQEQVGAALEALTVALGAARERNDDLETALALRDIATIKMRLGNDSEIERAEASAIFSRLGVINS